MKHYISKFFSTIGVIFFPLLLYSLLSFLLFFSLIQNNNFDSIISMKGPDSYGELWAINWWTFAFSQHINPFFTQYLWAPYGYNLTQTLAAPLLSFLAYPLVKIFGLVPAVNFITVSAGVLSAYTAFWLTRYITRSFAAALFGGFLFGFSTFNFAHMLTDDLCITVTFLIPLIALLLVLFWDQKLKPLLFTVLLSLLLAAQFYIDHETGVMLVLFFMCAFPIALVIFQSKRRDVWRIAKYTVIACFFTFLLISPLVYYFFATPKGDYPKNTIDNSTDLMNFIIPTRITWLGGQALRLLGKQFSANVYESGGYLGLPLVIICILYIRQSWKLPASRFLICMGILSALFTLGAFLHLFSPVHHIPLPWIIFNYLPSIREMEPARIMLVTTVFVSVVGALWMSTTKIKSVYKYALVASSIIFLLPNVMTHRSTIVKKLNLPAYFAKSDYKQDVPYGGTAMIFANNNCEAMYWQVRSGMWFKIVNGCTGGNPPGVISGKSIASKVYQSHFLEINYNEFHRYLLYTQTRVIIVSPNVYQRWNTFFSKMGYQLHLRDGMYVARVQN